MNIRFKSTLLPAVILIISFTALACAAASWNGSTGMEDGWPVVDNPDKPMHKDETIVAEEVWRLGHEDDEQEMVFGLISDGLIDEDGITYLLDSHLTTIYKVSPDGEVLGSIGREGDGPGEFRNIMNMIFMPDGSLGIFELMPGRIVTMGRDGEPRPKFAFGNDSSESMHNISRMAADKNSVVIGYSVFEFSDGGLKSTNTLARYAPDGSVMNVLFSQSENESGASVSFESEDGEFSRYWTMDKDGRVIVFKDNQKYSLDIFNPDGSHAMKIRRQYKPVRRSDEEIREEERSHEELRKRFASMDPVTIPKLARHISEVFARPNGDLWVQNSQGDRDRPASSIGYFDVFDHDGKYTKRLLIKADYDPKRDNYLILGDHLLVFKEAQNAPERTATSGGGNMQMIMVSGVSSSSDEDDEDPRPYEVVFYRLP